MWVCVWEHQFAKWQTHWRLKACQDQWLKSRVWNSSNDLVFQGVKGLSNSIRENICLHVLETGCVYLWRDSSLNQSLAEALGRAVDALSSRIVQGVLVQRPFGLSRQGYCFYRTKKNLRGWSGGCLIFAVLYLPTASLFAVVEARFFPCFL